MSTRNDRPLWLDDPDFKELQRSKNRISLLLTLATMLAFYGFVILLAWHQEWLAQPWSGSINRGIPMGIGVIVLSWILTGIYVRWANTKYDALVQKVKAKMSTADADNVNGNAANGNDGGSAQ